MNTLAQLLGREKPDVRVRLSRQVIKSDAIDRLHYEDVCEDAPSFRRMTLEDAPTVVAVRAPEPIDTLTATPEQIEAYRQGVMEYQAAARKGAPYKSWDELIADVYYSYHTLEEPEILDKVDVGVELHKKVMEQALASTEHREAREITRGDDILSAYATMRFVDKLKQVLGETLEEQMREQQELEELRDELQEIDVQIDTITGSEQPAPEGGEGQPGGEGGTTATVGGAGGEGPGVKATLSDKAKRELAELQSRQEQVEGQAEAKAEPKPLDTAAQQGIREAAQEGEAAAQEAAHVPSFGGGIGTGAGQPTYTSCEQAIEIMRRWAEDPDLRAMIELMGRSVREYRYKRAKRVENRDDEVIDVTMGDDLARVTPSEMALLSDPLLETDFLQRYSEGELVQYETAGTEKAGKGPVVVVCDGSGSMHGERNIYARAVALTLLQTTRVERRDFAFVEFSAGGQVAEWQFRARADLPGEQVLDMASHFFGGGTVPIIGVQRAHALLTTAPAFRKADVVLIGDGDGAFGSEDERLRDELKALGVRFFGIAIGGSWDYLKKYCEYVVDVHDFQLTEPGQAVGDLAERMA